MGRSAVTIYYSLIRLPAREYLKRLCSIILEVRKRGRVKSVSDLLFRSGSMPIFDFIVFLFVTLNASFGSQTFYYALFCFFLSHLLVSGAFRVLCVLPTIGTFSCLRCYLFFSHVPVA